MFYFLEEKLHNQGGNIKKNDHLMRFFLMRSFETIHFSKKNPNFSRFEKFNHFSRTLRQSCNSLVVKNLQIQNVGIAPTIGK